MTADSPALSALTSTPKKGTEPEYDPACSLGSLRLFFETMTRTRPVIGPRSIDAGYDISNLLTRWGRACGWAAESEKEKISRIVARWRLFMRWIVYGSFRGEQPWTHYDEKRLLLERRNRRRCGC